MKWICVYNILDKVKFMSQEKPFKVVCPAAGFGTRLLPMSPKEMACIVSKPGIEYIVDEVYTVGMSTVILIISKNKMILTDHFETNTDLENSIKDKKPELLESLHRFKNLSVISIRQSLPNGLGHAIFMAKPALTQDEFFVVTLPDMLIDNGSKYMNQMCELARRSNQAVIALMEVPRETVSSYGIVDGEIDSAGIIHIKGLVEKPSIEAAPSNLAILGRYVLPYRVIDILEQTAPDKGGEIQLTSALQVLVKESGILGVIIREEIHDIGSPLGFIMANMYYGMKIPNYKEKIARYCSYHNTK
jgi:UTP--glucose-1-phosphate uridylyltransferase